MDPNSSICRFFLDGLKEEGSEISHPDFKKLDRTKAQEFKQQWAQKKLKQYTEEWSVSESYKRVDIKFTGSLNLKDIIRRDKKFTN